MIILRGIPGSGKSTLVRERWPSAYVCSTDHFFDKDGEYKFDVTKLGEAHGSCMRRFIEGVQAGIVGEVVVDNTNTGLAEIAPYVAVAQAYGRDVSIVQIEADVETCIARGTHGVPAETVRRMAEWMGKSTLPPFWPKPEIVRR